MACIPHEYLYESGGIRRGMWTVSWFRNLFGEEIAAKAAAMGISVEAYLEREAREVPAGSDGLLTVLDWLAPVSEPHRKGAMIGFDGRHSRAHMYRSILEAIALTMKNHSEAMLEEMGMTPGRLIVIGGGSKSDLFMQIFADAYNLPAQRMEVPDAAGLGAAICAAVGAGVYPDFDTAVARMVRVAKVFTPIPEHVEIYGRINTAVYKGLRDRLEPILQDSYPIFH
jgi:sugar (pentulose or hexulose) kinase